MRKNLQNSKNQNSKNVCLTLNHECFDAFSAKGSFTISGLSVTLKREFARVCCEGYKYVNFEKDLGLSGLREMKVEYVPVQMIEKFILTEI